MKKYIIIIVLAITAIGFVACKKVTDITLSKSELLLIPNETEMLIATVYPDDASNKTITWKSDKPEIATVDNNGLVKAIANGKAIITASTKNGKQTATCLVSVDYRYKWVGDWEFVTDWEERFERKYSHDTIYYSGKISLGNTDNTLIINKDTMTVDEFGKVTKPDNHLSRYNGQFEGEDKVHIKYYYTNGAHSVMVKMITDGTKKKGGKK